jgi:hypothetical protein
MALALKEVYPKPPIQHPPIPPVVCEQKETSLTWVDPNPVAG